MSLSQSLSPRIDRSGASTGAVSHRHRLSAWMLSISDAWHQFWYTPADPKQLSMIRLLVGGMLVYTHLIWGTELRAFFGATGWQNAEVLQTIQSDGFAPSFWWLVNDSWLMPIHFVCLSVLILFWIGFATRMTSVLSLIIAISYAYRTQIAGFGLDQINTILCLYLCMGPSGAVLSVDRWLAVRRFRRRFPDGGRSRTLDVPRSSSANLALRLMQIHFCVIYFWAGVSKVQGAAWWSGEAVWLAFANLEYQSLDMTWVAWYPWLSDLMTHSTVVFELSFAALIWVRPLRPLVLAFGFLMHLGIGGVMGMWTFGLIMIFGHVAFWREEWVDEMLRRLPGTNRFWAMYETPAGIAPPAAAIAGIPASADVIAPTNNDVAAPATQDDAPPTSSDDTPPPDPDGELPAATDRIAPSSAAGETPRQPKLLCVGGGYRRRLACLGYFMERGFRCTAADSPEEARAIQAATSPDAIVVLASRISDEEIRTLHDEHLSDGRRQPLFLMLTAEQSVRFNGKIGGPGCYIFTGPVSLGLLRREIKKQITGFSGDRTTPETMETDQ